MCNIAGYSGDKQAAPILLEMLRKQEPYDGDVCTGVATIHQGKLYYKRIIGNVETFLKTFDVSELPGTIGIAHTRPSGMPGTIPMHPNINPNKTMALVTNGTTPPTKYCHMWDEAADLLEQNGYTFEQRAANPKGISPKFSSNGDTTSPAEMRVMLVDLYMKQGMTITQALSKSGEDMYSDNATVMIHQDYPENIYVQRTNRPINVILEKGEMYLATTRYGFPAELESEPIMLPLLNACSVSKNGICITNDSIQVEPVSEMTPYTYKEAYKRFEKLLKSEKGPFYFDDLELAVGYKMQDLWPGNHTIIQHARLVYDMLWQFDQEGRLQREMRVQDLPSGPRRRWYFSLKD